MGKIVFWVLILQIYLLSAVDDIPSELNINDNRKDFLENTQEDNASSNKKISFFDNDKVDSYFAVTFGLNTCFLSSSTSDYGTYGNKDSYDKVLLGENIGFSWIINNAESSRYGKWFLEYEIGLYYSKEMSDTDNYENLKNSKSVPYIQLSTTNRAVLKLNRIMFFSLGCGSYYGKGVSKEYRGDSYNLLFLTSYRIQNTELELVYKCRPIDVESLFVEGITMGEYTDIAHTTYQVLKLNLKIRF